MTDWKRIAEDAVPDGARFDVPRHEQGQIVEYSYADWPCGADEACASTARYQRVTDHSEAPGSPERVRYYIRTR